MENSKNIVMSTKELERAKIIVDCIDGKYTINEASQLLDLTSRQVSRLKKNVKQKGIGALSHQLRGRQSNRKIPEETSKTISDLINEKYWDFGPTFACEKLVENHNLIYGVETIRRIMIDNNIWVPKIRKLNSEYREWRPRKEHKGEMEQYDGSYHDWFEGRDHGSKLPCLLAAIDDATGEITYAKFDSDEGVVPTMKFWTEYFKINGKPLVIYLDRGSTYKKNKLNPYKILTKEEELTQFERACDETQVKLLHAKSPQGKGRVERLFGTLQNRLVKEMRLANINTIEEANEFLLQVFIPKFNKKFGVKATKKSNYHKILASKELTDLNDSFCVKENRVVANDFTVQHNNQYYQILEKQKYRVLRKSKVIVKTHLDNTIQLEQKGNNLDYKLLSEKPKPKKKVTISEIRRKMKPTPLSSNHPWRKTCPYIRKTYATTSNTKQ